MIVDPLAIFVWLLGLSVGSFLNVVVYRLPRDLSVAEPRWSFCPTCARTLSWAENVPLLSWLLQAGRCRGCRLPISAQYPLVEAATGLAFVLVYHALFMADAWTILVEPALPRDAALLLAWLILIAALVASSAMDIVSYLVDTRVTDLATLGGVLCLAAWPRSEVTGGLPGALSAAAVAAFLVSVVRLYVWPNRPPEIAPTTDDADPKQEALSDPAASYGPGVLFVLGLLSAAALAASAPGIAPAAGGHSRVAWIAAGLLLIVMIVAASPEREADDELHEQIEEESGGARRMVLGEFAWLLPMIVAATGAGLLVTYVPAAGEAWGRLVAWSPGGFSPVAGASFAMHGAMVGALAGWVVRIGFTLAFGREAFGVGDIYILAAAGACGGWEIALLGFLFAVPVALIIWLLLLLSKPTAMIAFGPPLALGFVVALLAYDPAAEVAGRYADELTLAWERSPRTIGLLAVFLVFATAVAVGVARLVRGLVTPADSAGK